MYTKKAGTIRASQLVIQNGVGSVLDLRSGSVIIRLFDDTLKDLFPEDIPEKSFIVDKNLLRKLRRNFPKLKGIIRIIPQKKYDSENGIMTLQNRTILTSIFPEWVFCPSCRKIQNYQDIRVNNIDNHRIYDNNIPFKCKYCFDESQDYESSPNLVPARLVIACENGHLDDFPWYFWAHLGSQCTESNKKRDTLEIFSKGKSSQLTDLFIRCTACNSEKDLGSAFDLGTIFEKLKCDGRRPERGDSEDCDKHPKPLLRGATNLYFSVFQSSLSITDENTNSTGVDQRIQVFREIFNDVDVNSVTSDVFHAINTILKSKKLSPFKSIFSLKKLLQQSHKDEVPQRIKEYLALTNNLPVTSPNLIAKEYLLDNTSSTCFSRVVLVNKLREIIVNTGFTRINYSRDVFSVLEGESGKPGIRICHINSTNQYAEYLPGVEYIGEGILFILNPILLDKWKTRLMEKRASSIVNSAEDKQVSPFLILTHSLSHALMVALSEVVGYSISSLRERLYVSLDVNRRKLIPAILIYTAGAGSEGSLGGLIGIIRNGMLDSVIFRMNQIMEWCTSDPVCIENEYTGGQFYNHSACHACLFIPETSCELMNQYLDRVTLVGKLTNRSIGYLNLDLGDEVF